MARSHDMLGRENPGGKGCSALGGKRGQGSEKLSWVKELEERCGKNGVLGFFVCLFTL